SSAAPIGSSITLFPVASSKVSAIGIDPPSRVGSGSTPYTASRSLATVRTKSPVRQRTLFDGQFTGLEVGIVQVTDPRPTGLLSNHSHSVRRLKRRNLFRQIPGHLLPDVVRVLVGHQSDRKLSHHLARNRCLRARTGESTLDSVH